MLHHELLKSKAYTSLSPIARAVMIEIAMLFNGNNNMQLAITWRELMERTGIKNARTIQTALNDLNARALVIPRRAHVWRSRGDGRATEYELGWQRRPDGPPRNDYRKWPEQVFPMAKPAVANGRASLDRQTCSSPNGPEPLEISSKPQLSVVASNGPEPSHIYTHHRGWPSRAALTECEHARKLSRAWLANFGRGGNRQLARQSAIAESRLSKFLSPDGKARTLLLADLSRLLSIVDPKPGKLNGHAESERIVEHGAPDRARHTGTLTLAQSRAAQS